MVGRDQPIYDESSGPRTFCLTDCVPHQVLRLVQRAMQLRALRRHRYAKIVSCLAQGIPGVFRDGYAVAEALFAAAELGLAGD